VNYAFLPLFADRSSGDESGLFHPAVAGWFARTFGTPTSAQAAAWPKIKAGKNTLIAAPTGSGKTLAAFLAAIDDLVRQGVRGELTDAVQVVYVSPLKALSNDIHRNLEAPLAGISEELRKRGRPELEIRSWVRTGDTPSSERDKMRRRPPHILVTTPESLYVLLGSESGRQMLSSTRSVIIDEIHAIAPNKRGVHLALSLERLSALCGDRLLRIGLSATQKPISEVANFLVGAAANGKPAAETAIIDTGHQRPRDLAIEIPGAPLEAVMSGEVWTEVYDRLSSLIEEHKTTLVFVNTRRMAERVARELTERLGAEAVTAHHGSMAKEHRLMAEQRLKRGELRALVATASLELGIDIGDVDLVCQISSPRAIAAFLQRVGRSGHSVGGMPKGRLFPVSRDDLVECTALLDSVRRGELDKLTIPENALDVLSQQIVAEVAAQDWAETALFDRFRRAWPYRTLERAEFDKVLKMLGEGFATRNGRRGSLLHHDSINGVLRGRRGARLTALTSGGTIPDTADYHVLLEPENTIIGTVNEDFAIESLSGDVFQLGNMAYRILRVERGTLRVEDAQGQPPTIPFWLGEAPGRTDELSSSVSRLRGEIADNVADAKRHLTEEIGLGEAPARQLADYLTAAAGAFGCLPTQDCIVFERFFDEAGGMQLVIHSPYGSRINRAWGLALRKRFCRKFNFELQAAATEDNIVLSLTTAHSFDLPEVARYLSSNSVRQVLIQAMLDAPMFITRWRWVAGVSLALPRYRGGKKVAPQIMRMMAEDLIAAVFPDQIACAENLVGEREVPDHPLTNQAIDDALHEAMDIEGLERLLRRIEAGEIRIVACDLTEPSPLAMEVLSARPYAFLDDAPLEERRTQAVMGRRWHDPQSASDLGRLDPEAIERVREEAWPEPIDKEELHDSLLWLSFLTEAEAAAGPGWIAWLNDLLGDRRVIHLKERGLWIAAERAAEFADNAGEEALTEILRGRMEGLGPVTPAGLAAPLRMTGGDVAYALSALESDGSVMRGRFLPGIEEEQWCDRRLLARIHQYTLRRLRAEIDPVAARDYLRFLFAWQHVADDTCLSGPDALPVALAKLEGYEAPARSWETEILAARVKDYEPDWLDAQCQAGKITWARLTVPPQAGGKAPVRATPIALLDRRHVPLWMALVPTLDAIEPSPNAKAIIDCLQQEGALFFDELTGAAHLLRSQVEEGLAELVALGLVTSDSFAGLRALLVPSNQRKPMTGARRRGRVLHFDIESGGRWALIRRPLRAGAEASRDAAVEQAARTLLRRYGVVFWRMLARESGWLPPWRDLLRVFRRMEARGEIRGGRFVAGFSGEQYALPEAVGALREIRRKPDAEQWVSLSAADPLNLAGILTPGGKLAGLTANRLLFRGGIPVATFSGGKVEFLAELTPAEKQEAEKRLIRSSARGSMIALA
jgi:ATP-dependent Lhr-like helicase